MNGNHLSLFYLCLVVSLGFAAHHAAALQLGIMLDENETFIDFMNSLLKLVYTITAIALVTWLIVGSAAGLFLAFAGGFFLTILRLDIDGVIEYYGGNNEEQ